jgi:hypothetical protein
MSKKSSIIEVNGTSPVGNGEAGVPTNADQAGMVDSKAAKPKPLARLRQEGAELLPESTPVVWMEELRTVLGVEDPGWAVVLLNSALNALPGGDSQNAEEANAIISALAEMKPNGVVEAMLAVQIVITHIHAMKLFARSNSAAYPGLADSRQSSAQRLLVLFLKQSRALSGLRQEGKQLVNVENVNVHQGGQAIVGIVNGR